MYNKARKAGLSRGMHKRGQSFLLGMQQMRNHVSNDKQSVNINTATFTDTRSTPTVKQKSQGEDLGNGPIEYEAITPIFSKIKKVTKKDKIP